MKSRREKIRRKRSNKISMRTRIKFSSRKKKLTKRLKRWKPYAKNKKMKDVNEMPRIKKPSKPNKPKSKRNWTWILRPNTSRRNGTGSKPRANSLLRRERAEKERERKRRSDHWSRLHHYSFFIH